MIRDFRADRPAIHHLLDDGDYALVFVMREHEVEAMDGCYTDVKQLHELFNLKRSEVVAFGDTRTPPPTAVMKAMLDSIEMPAETGMRKHYTCFDDNISRWAARHLSPHDSFNCIYHKVAKAPNMLFLRVKSDNIKEFNYEPNTSDTI